MSSAIATHRRDLTQVHPEMPDLVEGFLERRGWSWRQLERGESGIPKLEQITWWLTNSDPVIFAECNFVERAENGGGLWRLFDWQKPSLRYRGDVINRSAAGVGKTREIIVLILHALTNGSGSLLFVGNQDGTLATCWREIEFLVSRNPWLAQQLPEAGKRLKPYREWTAANGNTLFTRPTGHDGEPLRSIHVHQLILGDEAAKWHEETIFTELFRAAEPGCSVRLYSVPDGLRTTRFYRYAEQAVPLAALAAAPPPAPGSAAADRPWALVHWTKPMMPEPYWSPAVAAKLERQYGGRRTSGYLRNVLGLDGDPEEVVFSWPRLREAFGYIPEYRALQVAWDGNRGTVEVLVSRLNPGFTLSAGEVKPADAPAVSALVVERREEYPAPLFDLPAFLAAATRGLMPGQYVAGADFGGSSEEPTEILLFQVLGELLRCVLRVQLRSFDYPVQAQGMREVDRSAAFPSYGWGVDATGVGSAVEQQFRGLLADQSRLSGFVWNANRPLVHPTTGDPVADEHGQPRTVSHKEFATQLLELDVQSAALRLPWDPDMVREWSSHTSRKLPSGKRAFAPDHDHTIDAARAARLRRFDVELGHLQRPPIEHVSIPGARRDSYALLGGY